MDEPTVGADVEARSQILDTVRHLAAEGAAVVYTSHYLAEFEELRADVAVLNQGRLVAQGSLEQIVATYGQVPVQVHVPQADLHSAYLQILKESDAEGLTPEAPETVPAPQKNSPKENENEAA